MVLQNRKTASGAGQLHREGQEEAMLRKWMGITSVRLVSQDAKLSFVFSL